VPAPRAGSVRRRSGVEQHVERSRAGLRRAAVRPDPPPFGREGPRHARLMVDVLPWAGSLESAHGYGWLAPPSGPTRGSAAAAARDDHGHLNLRRKDDDATMRDRVLDYVSVLWPSRALRSGAVDDWLAPLGGTVGDADGTVLTARWARTAAERTYEADRRKANNKTRVARKRKAEVPNLEFSATVCELPAANGAAAGGPMRAMLDRIAKRLSDQGAGFWEYTSEEVSAVLLTAWLHLLAAAARCSAAAARC
jgi:hypothetical protein